VDRVRHCGLRRLGAIHGSDANVEQGFGPSLQRVDSQARIDQFVADRKRRYHGQARIEVSCPKSRLAFGIMR
jgi:hypothetical protein